MSNIQKMTKTKLSVRSQPSSKSRPPARHTPATSHLSYLAAFPVFLDPVTHPSSPRSSTHSDCFPNEMFEEQLSDLGSEASGLEDMLV